MRYFSALCQSNISQIYNKLKNPLLPFACKHRASCTMTNFFFFTPVLLGRKKKRKRLILSSMHFSSLKEFLFYRGEVHSKHWYYLFLQGSFMNRQPWSGCLSIITLLLITQTRATFNELRLKKKNPTLLANETSSFCKKAGRGSCLFFSLCMKMAQRVLIFCSSAMSKMFKECWHPLSE